MNIQIVDTISSREFQALHWYQQTFVKNWVITMFYQTNMLVKFRNKYLNRVVQTVLRDYESESLLRQSNELKRQEESFMFEYMVTQNTLQPILEEEVIE